MKSQVDASVPADNVAVDKALIRQNFARTKAEITALQRSKSLAWLIANGIKSL